MATEAWGNIGSGNGLVPDNTKPLSESMLTTGGIHYREFSLDIPQPSIKTLGLKVTYLEFHLSPIGADEFISRLALLYSHFSWLSNIVEHGLMSLFTWWSRDYLIALWQATCSNPLSLIEIVVLWFKCHWNCLFMDLIIKRPALDHLRDLSLIVLIWRVYSSLIIDRFQTGAWYYLLVLYHIGIMRKFEPRSRSQRSNPEEYQYRILTLHH